MSERALQSYGAALGSAFRRATLNALQRAIGRTSLIFPSPGTTAPKALVIVPESLRVGDPDRGRDIYRGHYDLASETVETGAILPFQCSASDDWHRELHSFRWLADLAAGDSELRRSQARSLLSDWIQTRDGHHPSAWQMDVTARRLLNLMFGADFLLEQAGQRFETAYFVSLGRHIRWIQRRLPFTPASLARLEAAIALSHASVCLDAGPKFRDAAFQSLNRELENQILPDGGHISRNPQTLVEILLALLPLANVIRRQGIEFPSHLSASIDRAVPMAKMLCHGDGGLAAFNGVDSAMRDEIRAILDHDEIDGKPVTHATHSGYCRLNYRNTNVIVDCGLPPTPPFASKAHAGALAFELSEKGRKIVVNCGESPADTGKWARFIRTTGAHSTATIANRSSSRLIKNRIVRRIIGGPVHWGMQRVSCKVDRHANGSLLIAGHDGYAHGDGLLHERALWLSRDGHNLRGEDKFVGVENSRRGADDQSFAIRFHLHPSVKVILSRDRNTAMLLLPDRSGWRFSAKGARLSLDESVYLIDRATAQGTTQIVLTGLVARGRTVNWAFKKFEKQTQAQADQQHSPELPL